MRVFLPFLLILLVIAAYFRIDVFFTIAYLFGALALLSHLWLRRAAGALRFHRRFVDRAFCGERVSVELEVQNQGRLPLPWAELYELLPVQLSNPPFYRRAIGLGAHERRSFSYILECRRRGLYALGPLRVQTGDLLGLQGELSAELAAQHLIVYPRVVALRQLNLPTRSPLVALPEHTPLFEDPARVMGVRDYQRGDSPRRVHWSASARVGRLLVKQYQPAIARETLICLNLHQGDYPGGLRYSAAELAIVVAASLANHILVHEQLPVGLTTEAWDPLSEELKRFWLPPRRERAQLMSLLEVLARVELAQATAFPDLLQAQSIHCTWGTSMAVITTGESPELLASLAQLRRAGFPIALILVQPTGQASPLLQQAAVLGIAVRQVWSEREL